MTSTGFGGNGASLMLQWQQLLNDLPLPPLILLWSMVF